MDCGGGIGFRENWANVAYENYFLRNHRAVGVGSCDSFIPVRVNTVAYNWMIDNDAGCFGPNTARARPVVRPQCLQVPQAGGQGRCAGHLQVRKQAVSQPAELRREVGQEIHGKVIERFDPAPLGLVTFRIPGATKAWEAVPMIGNPTAQRVDALQAGRDCPYFWRRGQFSRRRALWLAGHRQRLERRRLRVFQRHARRRHRVPAHADRACSAKSDKGPFDDPRR